MPGLGFFGLQPGHIQRQLRLLDAGVVVQGLLHPGALVIGHEGGQQHGQLQALGCRCHLSHHLVQRQQLDAQIVAGSDLLRQHQVVAGLGFALVGDGGRADLKVALGRSELLSHGGLLRGHKGQVVFRGEGVEISLAHAHDQVLLGREQLRLGLLDLLQALVVAAQVLRPVQRLRRAQGGALRTKGVADVGRGVVQA